MPRRKLTSPCRVNRHKQRRLIAIAGLCDISNSHVGNDEVSCYNLAKKKRKLIFFVHISGHVFKAPRLHACSHVLSSIKKVSQVSLFVQLFQIFVPISLSVFILFTV